jgi:anti-anti-sigma regulatory factor
VRTAWHGHVCWTFEESAAFQKHAREFLAEGVAAGERVWYVGLEPFPELSGVGAAVQYKSLASMYEGGVVDPPAQVAVYRAATEEALAEGYTGLRVAADGTPLVRTPEQLDAFARYEHLIDRYMRTAPFSAVCGFNRAELGGRTIAELTCMHPAGNAEALFRLCACRPGEGAATLAGEIDESNRELFLKALERADLRPTGGRLVLLADDLRFIDHRTLLHLEAYGHRHAATVVLCTPLPTVARLVKLFGLTRVVVESAA